MDHQAAIEAGDVALNPPHVFGVADHRRDVRRCGVRLLRMRELPETQELVVRQVDLRVLQRLVLRRVVGDVQRQVALTNLLGGNLALGRRDFFFREARAGSPHHADANRHRCRRWTRRGLFDRRHDLQQAP